MSYYNKISPGYNELHGEEQLKKLNLIKKYVKPGKNQTLLDVGCGTGISSQWNCRVTGIDPSEELLKLNAKKCIKGFAENLPFKDNSFDFVISITAVHNFHDIKKGLEEMKRVAKKEVIITVLRKSRYKNRIDRMIRELFRVKAIMLEDDDIIYFLSK